MFLTNGLTAWLLACYSARFAGFERQGPLIIYCFKAVSFKARGPCVCCLWQQLLASLLVDLALDQVQFSAKTGIKATVRQQSSWPVSEGAHMDPTCNQLCPLG
jgi:hypothetical protein